MKEWKYMPNNLKESYEMFKKAYKKLQNFIETDEKTEKQKEEAFHLQRSFGFVDKSSENP